MIRGSKPTPNSVTTSTLELSESDKERFWSKVDRTKGADACWEWSGYRQDGYGKFRIAKKSRLASRIAFTITHGPIQAGLFTLHRCDNPPCCNPAHLFVGDHKANSDDKIKKGRDRKAPLFGEAHPRAKLSEFDVLEIMRLLSEKVSHANIAAKFRVSKGTISKFNARIRWKHLIKSNIVALPPNSCFSQTRK